MKRVGGREALCATGCLSPWENGSLRNRNVSHPRGRALCATGMSHPSTPWYIPLLHTPSTPWYIPLLYTPRYTPRYTPGYTPLHTLGTLLGMVGIPCYTLGMVGYTLLHPGYERYTPICTHGYERYTPICTPWVGGYPPCYTPWVGGYPLLHPGYERYTPMRTVGYERFTPMRTVG